MPLRLDHVVVAVHDLKAAVQDYRELGFTVIDGGTHANDATHNALIVFEDGTYIELLAKTGSPPRPNLIDFSVLVGEREGLVGFALGTDDIDADAARLKGNGIATGEIVAGERRKPDEALIQWRLLQIQPDGETRGFAPFLIQDVTPRELRVPTHPDMTTHENRALGIDAFEIVVRSFKAAFKRYTAILGEFPRGYGGQHVMIDLAVSKLLILEPEAIQHTTYEAYQNWLTPNRAQPTPEERALSEDFQRWAETDQNRRKDWEREQEIALTRMAALENTPEAMYRLYLMRDADPDDRFALEKTHDARFRQVEGISKHRRDFPAGLDAVDWNAVTHAYGAATEVPKWLRMLTSDSTAVRERAYSELFNHVLHQGTVYPATTAVIPFVLQLLAAPDVPEKFSLLDFLLSATGSPFADEIDPNAAPGAYNSREYRELNQAIRAEFVKGAEIYIALLDDPDPVMRRSAANALALCPDHPKADAALQEHMTTETDPAVRATLIAAITKAWTREGKKPLSKAQIRQLETWWQTDESPAAQFQAALALIRAGNVDAGLATFYKIMSGDSTVLRAHQGNSMLMIFFDGMEALTAVGAWRPAFDWIATQAAHPDPRVRKDIAYPLEEMAKAWRPAVELGLPVLRNLLNDAHPDVRISAIGALWRFGGAMEKTMIHNLSRSDPLPSVRQIAANHIKNGQIPLPTFLEQKKLRTTTETLIEQLTALIDEPSHSAKHRTVPEMLSTLGRRGGKVRSALPIIRRYAQQHDPYGWTMLEAVRAWWRLAPEEGEQITATILKALYPIPASVYLIQLLGEMKGRAAAAIPTLDTIVRSEWRGDGFVGGAQSLDIPLDKALQDAAKRALRQIQKSR